MTTYRKELCRALIALLLLASASAASAAETLLPAFWLEGRIVAAVLPRPNEGYIQLAARVMAEPSRYPEVVAFNGNRTVMRGRPVRFPLNLLKEEFQGNILRSLYPDDELTERGWAHRVTDPLETLIQLTEAYTGSARRFRELARYNGLRNADLLRMGTVVTIPLAWISEGLRFGPQGLKAPLELIRDPAKGRIFASYRVRKDDTLYSLILRFTERERAEEVTRMSRELVRLNRLRNERALPAGRALRIPIEWIGEEYLLQKAARRPRPPPPVVRRKRVRRSAPVHVIVDPGHGGSDPGAVYGSRRRGNRIYEHEVVYDIALRLAGILTSMGIGSHLTVTDPAQPLPVAKLSSAKLGRERVAVNPPYLMQSPNTANNMRVFLIDSLFRGLTAKGVPPENVILISIHGDALAPTLRGAMVYYPDYRLRAVEFAPRGRAYRLRREAIPAAIRFRPGPSRLAHDLSRDFGEEIIRSFRKHGILVGSRKPVRSYYYRDGERTLPAVLRYSRVPTSVLVEVTNLNNARDRKALLAASTRQRIAKAVADAVDRYRREQSAVASSR